MAEASGAPDAVDFDEAGDRSSDPGEGTELEKKESGDMLAESDGLQTSVNFEQAKVESLVSPAEIDEQIGEKRSTVDMGVGCDLVDGNVQDAMEVGSVVVEALVDAEEVQNGERVMQEGLSLEIGGGTPPQDSSVEIKNVEQVDEKAGGYHGGEGNQETNVSEEESAMGCDLVDGNVQDVMEEGSIEAPVDAEGLRDGTGVVLMDAIGHDTMDERLQATTGMSLEISEDMLPQDSSMGADPGLAARSSDTHLIDENAMIEGDIAMADANPVVKLATPDIQLVSSSSAVGTENGDTGALGEKHTVREDTVLGDSNSVVETSTWRASEISEIQIVQSQGKESVDTLIGMDQDIQVQPVGTSVHGDLGTDVNISESPLGESQNVVTELESVEKDSPLNACFEKVEPNQESEVKQEIQAPSDMGNVLIGESADGMEEASNKAPVDAEGVHDVTGVTVVDAVGHDMVGEHLHSTTGMSSEISKNMLFQDSSTGVDPDLSARSADATHLCYENAMTGGDITNVDANLVTELESQGTKNGDTGALCGKHMVRGDTVLGDSNSVVETSSWKASEMSEILITESQGEESVDTLNGMDQDIKVQSVGTSVCGDLAANANILQSCLGKSQNIATEFESMKKDISPLDACFQKVEPNQESEFKQEILAPSVVGNVLMDEGADGLEEGSIEAPVSAKGVQDGTGVLVMDATEDDSVYGHLQATTGTSLQISEDMLPQDFSMATDSNVQEADCSEDHHTEDPNIQYANTVVELESQACTENVDTGPLGEKYMVKGDIVLGNSKSMIETSTWKASEMSVIHNIQSQGKESVNTLNCMDQDIEVQSVGTLYREDLGENANKLESSPGASQNIVTEFDSLQNDMPQPNECFEKVEPTHELEVKQELQDPGGMGNVLRDEDADGKQKVLVGEGELSKGTGKQSVQSADTHLFDENAIGRGDIAKADANTVVELESQGIQFFYSNPNDKGGITKLVSSSVVCTENGDTGALVEEHMVRGDGVWGKSNSVVETSTWKASEMSEIQIGQSQGKESINTLNGMDQDIELHSVGTLVCEDPGANADKLEPSLGKSQNIVTEFESLKNDMSLLSVCLEEIESTQVSEAKQELQAPSDLGNLVMDEGADGEQKVQLGEGELSKGTEATNIGVSVMENMHHVTYCLPSLDKADFSISDLVWGKVKSHPWWPGQIFDPADASQLALKYQKKDSFLVAYFGDKTFAWCDASQLKPFCSYFSQMVKQCSLESSVTAVNDILMEISRRVELGMTCSCLPEEAYANIKFQKVDNAGVRRGNVNSIVDRHLILNYFQPGGLIEYIKTLAQFPNGGVDKLELGIARSQLKAFYCTKGYPELPVFTVHGGLIEDVAENLPSKGPGEDSVKHSTPSTSDLISGKAKLGGGENSFKKRKHVLEDDRKQKSVSELTDKEHTLNPDGGKSKSGEKASKKLISSGTKHTVIGSDSADSGRHKKRTLDFFEDIEPQSISPTVISSFKIGEFIRRAASQLTGAPPIVKCQGEPFQKDTPNADHKQGDVTDFDVLPHPSEENEGEKTSFSDNNSSPDEILSQLCLAATDPLIGHSFVSTMVAFFTSFRNSCVSSTSKSKKPVEKRKRGRPKKVIPQPLFTELFSDISSSDDKHVEKCKRGRPRRVECQPAISDISSSEEKQPVVKCSSQEQHVEKRRRGRPKKVSPRPAISDISSSEEKQVEKRKRGRPKKITSQLDPSDMSTPDHMKDSYWSDINLQKRSRKKFLSDDRKRKGESHMQIRQKRRSAGEQTLLLPSGSILHNEKQLQLVAVNSNKKHSFIVERPIISVEERIVDECMPTALILSFSSSGVLPSATDLIRIFSRYGPLKEAETDVLKKSNCAKVIFKRRADAETAFSSAGKFSIFGPGLLSYQLKYWSSSPPAQETAQVHHDEASVYAPEENHDTPSTVTLQDNHNPRIVIPQGNLNPATLTALPHEHDEEPMTAPHNEHDTATISRPEDDSGPIPTPQEKNVGAIQGCNLEISELAENEIASDIILVEGRDEAPQQRCDASSSATPVDKQDATIITPGDYHYVASFTSLEDHQDEASITATQEKYVATDIEDSNLPEDKYEATLIANPWEYDDAETIPVAQDCQDATVITTAQEKYDTMQVGNFQGNLNPAAQDYYYTSSIVTPQDNRGMVTPEGNLNPETLTALPHKHNEVPMTAPRDEQDTSTVNRSADDSGPTPTPQEKKAGVIQELAESGIASDSILAERRVEELPLQERYDAASHGTPQDKLDATIIIPGDYDDVGSFTTSQDHQDVALITTTTQDKCRATHIESSNIPEEKHDVSLIAKPWDDDDAQTIPASQDHEDATPTTTVLEKYDATLEQSETPMLVNRIQAEAEELESSQ